MPCGTQVPPAALLQQVSSGAQAMVKQQVRPATAQPGGKPASAAQHTGLLPGQAPPNEQHFAFFCEKQSPWHLVPHFLPPFFLAARGGASEAVRTAGSSVARPSPLALFASVRRDRRVLTRRARLSKRSPSIPTSSHANDAKCPTRYGCSDSHSIRAGGRMSRLAEQQHLSIR